MPSLSVLLAGRALAMRPPGMAMVRRIVIAAMLLAQPVAHAGLRLEPLPVPATPPAAQPSVAVDGKGSFHLSWQERRGEQTALKFARWNDDAMGEPRTIAAGSGWFVNWADFPSLAVLDDGALLAHWLQKSSAATYAYDVMLVRSDDGGRRWSRPLRVHDDATQTEHGFVALAPLGGGRALLAWLDGRNTAGGHAHDGGAMSIRAGVLAGAAMEQVDSVELDASTCDCCQTDAARTPDGAVLVYRDREQGEVRDIKAVRWTDAGFDAPTPVHEDAWVMPACPVNGPAVAARGNEVVVAWYTEGAPGARVLIARSRDGGRHWEAPVVLERGAQGRVDVAMLGNGEVLATWLATDASDTVLRLARLDPRLRELERHEVTRLPPGRGTGFPRLAASANEAVLAWTAADGGAPTIAAVRITRSK